MVSAHGRRLATRAMMTILAGVTVVATTGASAAPFRNPEATNVIDWLPRSQPTARVRYANESPLQFFDVRVPKGLSKRAHPLIIFIHGGGWTSDWNMDSANALTERLADAGYAVMNVEYRRLGNDGGGYPGTFQDIARAVDHARTVAGRFRFDMDRVLLVGHSAGAHLALWAAGRHNLPAGSLLRSDEPLPVKGVIGLGSVAALEDYIEARPPIRILIGEPKPDLFQARLSETSPGKLLPMRLPQVLIDGTRDDAVRVPANSHYVQMATKSGDQAGQIVLEGANHFDMVDTRGGAWPLIAAHALSLAGIEVSA